ncbi:hypothetical protein Dsin_013123 [Dipteronia sinensis]|uniref:Uncharacterized protein n=1 Tax=Dipteronia sinensis TaxID=43782 RepID=A0AAE0AJU2_9ROSI|nr:hypothetical protein Dsin_013123 [Dipteronia sinensis]
MPVQVDRLRPRSSTRTKADSPKHWLWAAIDRESPRSRSGPDPCVVGRQGGRGRGGGGCGGSTEEPQEASAWNGGDFGQEACCWTVVFAGAGQCRR